MRLLQYLCDSVASVLFVRTCAACGCRVEGEKDGNIDRYICCRCMALLPRTEHFLLRNNKLEDMFYKEQAFVRAAAFLYYRGDDSLPSMPHWRRGVTFMQQLDRHTMVQALVHRFKYMKQPEVAYELGLKAAKEGILTDFFDGIDVIIPVPLHPRRLRKRGYNQSEYIAKALSEVTKVPMATGYLVRKRDNPQQAMKSGAEREENVRDLFKVRYPEELFRKHILLVDDVVTTGSTIRACMEALRECLWCSISVFAIAIAH
ncbi:MAG: ComF family protein [Paludibacteraceae bacterium]|nr:ComF family protein [Paludibacteraceae bacterium]